ncbi:MAG: hypothetical protein DI605_01200 [Sphingomonas sp.]|nr:MAG: hypothetical protein DI605_01200 [Sphingomonas sp.]
MLAWNGSAPTVELCDGMATTPMQSMHMPMMGHHSGHEEPTKKSSRDQMPCAFGAATAHSSVSVDPALLAAAIIFIVVTVAFSPVAQGRLARARPYLRPPLRGPPVL